MLTSCLFPDFYMYSLCQLTVIISKQQINTGQYVQVHRLNIKNPKQNLFKPHSQFLFPLVFVAGSLNETPFTVNVLPKKPKTFV